MDTPPSPALNDQVPAAEGEYEQLFSFPSVSTINWEQGVDEKFRDMDENLLQEFIAVINDEPQQTSVIEGTDAGSSYDHQIWSGGLPMQEDQQPSLAVTSPPRDCHGFIAPPARGCEVGSQDRYEVLNHVTAALNGNGQLLHIGQGRNLQPNPCAGWRIGASEDGTITMWEVGMASQHCLPATSSRLQLDDQKLDDQYATQSNGIPHPHEPSRSDEGITFAVKTDDIHLDDGFTWRKYGNKPIKNMTFRRAYFRCAEIDRTGCTVQKYVQRRAVEEGPQVDYTYIGVHNHPARKPPGKKATTIKSRKSTTKT